MDHSHSYILIMAGGAGTRLWPISRQKRPKQFQSFVDDHTMLQHMAILSREIVPQDHIFVMATPEFATVIGEQLPDLPTENLLFEPARRDNGPAITLGMLQIHQRDPQATVAILWSDHLIQQPAVFVTTLKASLAVSVEYPESLVTVGAKPLYPDPSLGYIQMGDELGIYESAPVFKVRQFIEKPDLETATRFVASWEYLWNVGYKIMSTKEYLKAFHRVQPELRGEMDLLEAACASGNHAKITEVYEDFPKLSIEHLFTPFLTDLIVVPGDLGWSDIGSWNVLHDVLKERDQKDFISEGDVLNIESENCLVFARDSLIVTVGVKDLVVVDEGDAILIMNRAATGSIKKVTQKLQESNRKELL